METVIVIVVALAVWLWLSNRESDDDYICRACGHRGVPESGKGGSAWILLILLMLYIIPGVIYWLWRRGTGYKSCPACGSKEVIPVSTPMGQKLAQEFHAAPRN